MELGIIDKIVSCLGDNPYCVLFLFWGMMLGAIGLVCVMASDILKVVFRCARNKKKEKGA